MILWWVICYLIGSIPIAKWVTKKKLNFYSTSEVIRQTGWRKGLIVGTVDISKGFFAVGLAHYYGFSDMVALVAGLSAVAGQIFPIFNGFKGGGGILTSYGSLLFINLFLANVAFAIVLPFVIYGLGGWGIMVAWFVTHPFGTSSYVMFATGHAGMILLAGGIRLIRK